MSAYCRKHNKVYATYCLTCAMEAEDESSLAAMPGSLAHVRFEIKTEQGNTAIINGDPAMPEATRKAMGAMIDALVKAANAGELKVPENDLSSVTVGAATDFRKEEKP